MDSETFLTLLRASMLESKRQGKRGVWIKMPIGLANLVETAVKEGFKFHHAEPKYLMLVYWIPKTENTIPANASHRVGVGAIVLNEKRELLVVQENSGRFKGSGIWKIPTGIVEQGEDIFVAGSGSYIYLSSASSSSTSSGGGILGSGTPSSGYNSSSPGSPSTFPGFGNSPPSMSSGSRSFSSCFILVASFLTGAIALHI